MNDARVDIAELHAPFTHQELILREALGLADASTINPSGGALAGNPIMAAGLARIGEAQPTDPGRPGRARRRPRHLGPVPAAEPRLRPGGRVAWQSMQRSSGSARPSTTPGASTSHRSGLFREAAERALEDADLTWNDIDAVVIGKAPDIFEGVMMPELFLAEALGCGGKPMLRVHTAGSVGGIDRASWRPAWSRPASTSAY